ncbi:hypothetical protein C2S51_008782, partial [Perilla frutescens var. frutescens]
MKRFGSQFYSRSLSSSLARNFPPILSPPTQSTTVSPDLTLSAMEKKPLEIFPLFLLISTILHLITPSKSVADYTNIVYKGCAKQSLPDSTGVYSQSLSSIYGTLLAQSLKSKFFNTSTGSGQSSISGLFQCSGFAQIFGMEMLYKSCGVTNVGGAGFEDMRDTALNSLENGMSSSNGGFYTTSYESVYVLGQSVYLLLHIFLHLFQ